MLWLTGVPLSNQWGHHGYFYPIQIAQYGLSHYSKYVKKSDKLGRPVVIEDAEDGSTSRWSVTGDIVVHNVFDADVNSRVVQFQTSGKPFIVFFSTKNLADLPTPECELSNRVAEEACIARD